MNKPIKELIQRLKEPDYQYYGCELCKSEADLAISALEQQLTNEWIPIKSRYDYPFVNGDYLITVRYENFAGIYDNTTMATFDGTGWTIHGVQPVVSNKKIIAWCELPEPYEEVSE